MTPEELDAIDPTCIDSVTGDRLLHTIKQMQIQGETLVRAYEDQVHKRVALWLAIAQDDAAEAALKVRPETLRSASLTEPTCCSVISERVTVVIACGMSCGSCNCLVVRVWVAR